MGNSYLAREDAPFGAEIWGVLDAAMVEVARNQLAGRRLLPIEGPFGVGLKAVSLRDVLTESGLLVGEIIPVPWIYRTFTLGKRDLAAYEREKISLDLGPLVETTIAVARIEDELVFNGAPGVVGLLNAPDTRRVKLSPWTEVGAAANDIIQAITLLDGAGFHGPYSLALSPERYNLLLRIYPGSSLAELEHIRSMVTDGVSKAPALEKGGVLVASGRQYASILLGQDMSLGFIGPVADRLEFSISESLAVMIRQPGSMCVLE